MEYGLIGERLGHSYSKELHDQIGDYGYMLKEIPRSDVPAFMQEKAFKAINVTIPYKETVIPFMDFIDDAARAIGSVNTVVNRNGRLYGYNTDFLGLRRLVLSTGLDLEGKKVLILGTGGTSKTSRAVASSLGASEILVVSRRPSEGYISYERAMTEHSDASVIINATPAGMYPDLDKSPVSLDPFKSLEGVVDVIYNPLRTALVQDAQKRGLKARGGLLMLVQQAIAAAEFFFDTKIDQAKSDAVYQSLFAQKRNIVLVGMPGCGKTTIGRILAERLGCTFLDTDVLIEALDGRHPSAIIREDGEAAFRDVESRVCAGLAPRTNVVIATGGGAVLRDENVRHLKNNGLVFFLDRDLESIRPTGDRPLSSSVDKLRAIYEKRYGIYCRCADYRIMNNEGIEEAVTSIERITGAIR